LLLGKKISQEKSDAHYVTLLRTLQTNSHTPLVELLLLYVGFSNKQRSESTTESQLKLSNL